MKAEPSSYLSRLHPLIDQHFSLPEIRKICFDLGIDYEHLPGEEKVSKIISLLQYLERRGKVERLLNQLRSDRPNVVWPEPVAQLRREEAPPTRKLPVVLIAISGFLVGFILVAIIMLFIIPESTDFFILQGKTFAVRGNFEQAITEFNWALALDSNNAEAIYNRGNAYYGQRDYAPAIADFRRYLELDPQAPNRDFVVNLISEMEAQLEN